MSTIENRIYEFHGGLHLERHKKESLQGPIQLATIPKTLILPIQQHIGEPAVPVCKVGDEVLKGQVLAQHKSGMSVNIHAPSSGTIREIGLHYIPHPSGLKYPCITLETDGEDLWHESILNNKKNKIDFLSLDSEIIFSRIQSAGLVGLGGAAFPSYVKLKSQHKIKTLIINAAECEPYITCDNALIQERAKEICEGINILIHFCGATRCLIGIEDDMTDAISALKTALAQSPNNKIKEHTKIKSIPTLYPTGGEKQLIKVLCNKEVPRNGLPIDIGMICHNIGTAYALYKLVIEQEPLISRIITITGNNIKNPGNYQILIGTAIKDIVELAGGYIEGTSQLIMGGPMMGFSLNTDQMPIVKATNCILINRHGEVLTQNNERACIRCGDCAKVCPAQLLPQQLYWYARSKEFDKVQDYNLFDCIECGCCAYVCPSELPLVQYYRYAKTQIWSLDSGSQKAELAKRRFDARTLRLELQKQAIEEKRERKKAALNKSVGTQANEQDKKLAIQDAVDRVKKKQQKNNMNNDTDQSHE